VRFKFYDNGKKRYEMLLREEGLKMTVGILREWLTPSIHNSEKLLLFVYDLHAQDEFFLSKCFIDRYDLRMYFSGD